MGGGGAPAPTVTSVAPTSGPTGGGTSVTISGSDFVSGATVKFGGTSATGVNFVNSTTITANAPSHSAGAVGVEVENPDTQKDTLSSGYTYIPQPTVSSVSPIGGPPGGGTSVTISGTDFLGPATVTFGGTSADERYRRQLQHDHGHRARPRTRRCECRGDELGWPERHP